MARSKEILEESVRKNYFKLDNKYWINEIVILLQEIKELGYKIPKKIV